jgi:hypothetical protein
LSPKGSAASFSQVDDKSAVVVEDKDFPRGDRCIWRLQSAPDPAGTRLTATDDGGNRISAYDRVVKATFIPSYTVGLVFGTAVGYDLTVDHCSATGEVIENIAAVKYTDGSAADHAEELIQLDLGDA